METILQITDLEVSYGSVVALKDITFNVKSGEIVVLVGANGAGKTTTLRAISGLVKPKKGEIIFEGKRIDHLHPHKIVRLGISHAPEGRRIFGTLTVYENLMLGAYTQKQIDKNTLEWIYNLFPRLKERSKQLAGTLSGGEQQMLAVGRALMSKPKLLLLDEPSLGLSPALTKIIFDTVKQIRNSGVTILMVEQNAKAALKFANRGYVLEVGKIVLSGTSEELLSSQKVVEAYLGRK
ncbi:MAG: ABC transporter ATP-binding protein [Desulfurella sp.]|jgi:branched-chain amino acid transport system ATP-binding protein|uniref:Amino acid/amide ABC transporter ATP-binding protein 2, HAAT family (TC 3.A.1.4.-) n=2 Tax=Desulfurellaceae TaxID=117942 RepID=A0A1G6KRW3_9BACT|nr:MULTISPECIES: ABC transporter ATP-binding protein [Desulfurella]PMP62834.1 MAG: ABC transporter ATP-binding protein [Desulfurella multipotens]PMP91541.1 MAG: ABC transporter ATP-binding protein [Desulfurella sp.]SDC33551.1 amino acid/amide ABC transporter ATP-binding protein 2, HAAT family (TC 3.A.1.4.-) [Desulfurella multipotens]HEX13029.1 ABC transporter ATP-binding protein [Desulfurella acetivorans]